MADQIAIDQAKIDYFNSSAMLTLEGEELRAGKNNIKADLKIIANLKGYIEAMKSMDTHIDGFITQSMIKMELNCKKPKGASLPPSTLGGTSTGANTTGVSSSSSGTPSVPPPAPLNDQSGANTGDKPDPTEHSGVIKQPVLGPTVVDVQPGAKSNRAAGDDQPQEGQGPEKQ
ncbi:MAG: hypothetical protein ACHP7N_02875 [Caulobacterales bacterium]